MKTLSYIIDGGQIIITGDSSKGTDIKEHKQFLLGDPSYVYMETQDEIKIFFSLLLQGNHEYSFNAKNHIVIDGINYIVTSYRLESLISRHSHYFPSSEKRNFFKLYQDFVRYHHEEAQLINLENKLNDLLEKFDIDKAVSSIAKGDDGIYIRVSKYTYQETSFPNFLLLLRRDNTLKFLHFFEQEGEHYSNGNTPLRHEDIVKEIERQRRLLNKYDMLYTLFNNVTL